MKKKDCKLAIAKESVMIFWSPFGQIVSSQVTMGANASTGFDSSVTNPCYSSSGGDNFL